MDRKGDSMEQAALILEGGASRGVFTGGVLDYLMEQGILFSYVCGVSAGSGNGMNYLSQQIGRTKRVIIRGKEDGKMMSLKSLVKNRMLFDMELLYHEDPLKRIPFDFDRFFHSPMKLEMVATNCLTGEAAYLSETQDRDRLMKICRASSSLPLVTPMVEVDGIPYLDGGIADSIPIRRAMELGYRKIVLVLTRQYGYRKKTNARNAAIYEAAFSHYPALARSINLRPAHYNQTIRAVEKWEQEGNIFVIRPESKPVSRTEQNQELLEQFYEHGYAKMEEKIEDMLAYLRGECV